MSINPIDPQTISMANRSTAVLNTSTDDSKFFDDLMLNDTFSLENQKMDENWFKTILDPYNIGTNTTSRLNNTIDIRNEMILFDRESSLDYSVLTSDPTFGSTDTSNQSLSQNINLFTDNCKFLPWQCIFQRLLYNLIPTNSHQLGFQPNIGGPIR